jgi:MFS family permease
VRTILKIPTIRYALVGASSILFVVTAVATWMPTLYERQFHLSQGRANLAFGSLVILAGVPGTLIGGMMADRWVHRFLGARVVIPGVCIAAGGALLLVSFIPMPFAAAFALQLVGFLIAASSIPALSAGLTDVVPAQLRGTGNGAFNMTSIVFGSAAAPLLTAAIATHFGGNYRVAFAIVMPVAFVGSLLLLAARRHIEADTAKIFEAIQVAPAEQQQRAGTTGTTETT